jgi:REP element-mobilizing transposase RayT
LEQWRQDRLKYPVLLLSMHQRQVVENEIERHCSIRNWRVWTKSARSNHVHAVVTAPGVRGSKVRDQLKANATRSLREVWNEFRDRPVWTALGDWQCINTEEDLEQVIIYVSEAQDRMGLE